MTNPFVNAVSGHTVFYDCKLVRLTIAGIDLSTDGVAIGMIDGTCRDASRWEWWALSHKPRSRYSRDMRRKRARYLRGAR